MKNKQNEINAMAPLYFDELKTQFQDLEKENVHIPTTCIALAHKQICNTREAMRRAHFTAVCGFHEFHFCFWDYFVSGVTHSHDRIIPTHFPTNITFRKLYRCESVIWKHKYTRPIGKNWIWNRFVYIYTTKSVVSSTNFIILEEIHRKGQSRAQKILLFQLINRLFACIWYAKISWICWRSDFFLH